MKNQAWQVIKVILKYFTLFVLWPFGMLLFSVFPGPMICLGVLAGIAAAAVQIGKEIRDQKRVRESIAMLERSKVLHGTVIRTETQQTEQDIRCICEIDAADSGHLEFSAQNTNAFALPDGSAVTLRRLPDTLDEIVWTLGARGLRHKLELELKAHQFPTDASGSVILERDFRKITESLSSVIKTSKGSIYAWSALIALLIFVGIICFGFFIVG